MNKQITIGEEGAKMTTFFGIAAIILGILAMLAPGVTGISVAMAVGFLVVVGGILRMVWAFKASSLGRGILTFMIGCLTFVAGLVMLANPYLTTGVLTLLLAAYFFVDGIFEVIAAFKLRSIPGWGWMLFTGIVSILLGVLIWEQFPLSGIWAIGTLFGIKLFLVGLMMITFGREARQI